MKLLLRDNLSEFSYDTFSNHLASDERTYFCRLKYIYGPGSDLIKKTDGKTKSLPYT